MKSIMKLIKYVAGLFISPLAFLFFAFWGLGAWVVGLFYPQDENDD